jgi:DNA polymerase (family 10)
LWYRSSIVDNAAVARLFDELADLQEIAGENPFKTRAYRAFAQTAREHREPIESLAARGELLTLPGVGKAIAAKVDAAMHTGAFPALERARAAVPETVRRLLDVPGLGPQLVRTLWKDAGIASLGELSYACEEHRLAKVEGIGAKRQARIHAAVRAMLEKGGGALLGTALAVARVISALLLEAGAAEVVAVGDARRGVEVVRELVILVRGIAERRVAGELDGQAMLEGAVARSASDGATLVIHGLSVRVRVVSAVDWVHTLVVGTGRARHVAWLESKAEAGGKTLAAVCARARTEEQVYAALGVPFTPPELREGSVKKVPDDLVSAADVQGFFHVHTDWSDGTAPILGMARAAARGGFRYLGISDHSRAASYANGLDGTRLREQAKAIAIARREQTGCTIFHGVEVDVMEDGSLDLDDDVLASLDFVIASVHAKLAMPPAEMTARIVRAVSHPLVTILGHPTGRLLLGRKGYAFDLEAVARAAAANDTYLEINANAQRLDLCDDHVRRAAKLGARFAIDPDAHADRGIDETGLGVMVARRAGLARDQVLNARDRDEVRAVLAARKEKALARLRRA